MENGKSLLNQKSQDMQTFEEWLKDYKKSFNYPLIINEESLQEAWEAGHTAGDEMGYKSGFAAGWTQGFWDGKEDEHSLYV